MGLDWWTHDRHLSPAARRGEDDEALERACRSRAQLLQGNGHGTRSTRERRQASSRATK
jgi:hypothetical protein